MKGAFMDDSNDDVVAINGFLVYFGDVKLNNNRRTPYKYYDRLYEPVTASLLVAHLHLCSISNQSALAFIVFQTIFISPEISITAEGDDRIIICVLLKPR
jgi:hypothetical protein